MGDTDRVLALVQRFADGQRPPVVAFWGHTTTTPGRAGPECLSQWYPAPFQHEGRRFATAEHFMMFSKAMTFGDDATARRVLDNDDPAVAKRLGRGVRGFDTARWEAVRFGIVVLGSTLKFTQHEALRAYLLSTGDAILVEASPVDRIWGVGLAADDQRVTTPAAWRGLNLLGFALMEARATLAERE